ncbi:flavin-containing protein [Fusarium mexicanum]|uniref:Flavin-containing protein n=1 Tax=Fusarium mexicanum TaxID=751941 RepID=A0A8H5JFP7_9HYPO|nr:flavin-containing protein [Fusarium mexicanum]
MGSLTQPTSFDVHKIAIIGAGPTGLAAAKYLIAQGFEDIAIFEQQDHVGGIWRYYGLAPGTCPVPQEDPHCPPENPIRWNSTSAPIFTSPMYENLHANIPKEVMRFSDQAFPEDSKLFPERPMIEDYLVNYADDVKPLIRFCQRVERVALTVQDGRDRWEVETQSTINSGEITTDTFDALVVANGHYSIPYLPNMKNLKEFNEAYPGVITHSKQYRTPYPFRDSKVVVIGNGPSGLDIALQINQECRKPAILSVRHPTPPDRLAHSGCTETAEVEEFLVEEKGIRFKDGRVETDIDAIIFCTGFLFSFPFLEDLGHQLITTGRGVHGLYQHVFNIQHPTLVFPGLNMKAAPWPLSESQAALFSAVWSNNIELPSREAMEAWSQALEKQEGDALHVFGPNGDGYYINKLHDWIMEAKRPGKEPPYWNDELMWQRSMFLKAKARFEQLGCKAQTFEEIGFHYEPGAQADVEKGGEEL